MTVMTSAVVHDGFTEADLDALPDDGRRHDLVDGVLLLSNWDGTPVTKEQWAEIEPPDGRRVELVDGVVVVTPSPRYRHQRVLGELFARMRDACPGGVEALFAPFDYHVGELTVVEPDLLVFRTAEVDEDGLHRTPLLVAEVRSRSTARYDAVTKRRVYAAAGVPSYWLVDPDEPSLTVLELQDGEYVERAVATGDEEVAVERPFPLTLRPRALQ